MEARGAELVDLEGAIPASSVASTDAIMRHSNRAVAQARIESNRDAGGEYTMNSRILGAIAEEFRSI